MRNMFWLGLFGVITLGMAGIAQAASEGAAPQRRMLLLRRQHHHEGAGERSENDERQ